MAETIVEKQVRLILERQCREIADKLKADCPAGVGFLLFLTDYGEKGNVSYVSSVERDGAIRLVDGWLERQGTTQTPVTARVQADTLRNVADGLAKIVPAVASRRTNPGATLQNVVAHLRRDADAIEAITPTKGNRDGS